MRILIAGSRSIERFDFEEYIPKDVTLIISGGASGVDTLAEAYADRHRLSKLILRPRYDLYGKVAPIKRNEQMIDIADMVLVVWDGISKGAGYTIKYAKKKNKEVRVVLLPSNGCKQ